MEDDYEKHIVGGELSDKEVENKLIVDIRKIVTEKAKSANRNMIMSAIYAFVLAILAAWLASDNPKLAFISIALCGWCLRGAYNSMYCASGLAAEVKKLDTYETLE